MLFPSFESPNQHVLAFSIAGVPKPKQSTRFRTVKTPDGRVFGKSYQPAKVVKNENDIKVQIISQLPNKFIPFSKGVRVRSLKYVFPPIKGLNKAQMEMVSKEMLPKTTKPDLTDNLNKALFDALEGIVYLNDSQICEINNVVKVYGDKPRIELIIEEIPI